MKTLLPSCLPVLAGQTRDNWKWAEAQNGGHRVRGLPWEAVFWFDRHRLSGSANAGSFDWSPISSIFWQLLPGRCSSGTEGNCRFTFSSEACRIRGKP